MFHYTASSKSRVVEVDVAKPAQARHRAPSSPSAMQAACHRALDGGHTTRYSVAIAVALLGLCLASSPRGADAIMVPTPAAAGVTVDSTTQLTDASYSVTAAPPLRSPPTAAEMTAAAGDDNDNDNDDASAFTLVGSVDASGAASVLACASGACAVGAKLPLPPGHDLRAAQSYAASASDGAGGAYVALESHSTDGRRGWWSLHRLSAAGRIVWSTHTNSSMDPEIFYNSVTSIQVAPTPDGDAVIIAGSYQGTMTIGGAHALPPLNFDAAVAFAARLNASDGSVQWATGMGSEGENGVVALSSVSASGHVMLIGSGFGSGAWRLVGAGGDATTTLRGNATNGVVAASLDVATGRAEWMRPLCSCGSFSASDDAASHRQSARRLRRGGATTASAVNAASATRTVSTQLDDGTLVTTLVEGNCSCEGDIELRAAAHTNYNWWVVGVGPGPVLRWATPVLPTATSPAQSLTVSSVAADACGRVVIAGSSPATSYPVDGVAQGLSVGPSLAAGSRPQGVRLVGRGGAVPAGALQHANDVNVFVAVVDAKRNGTAVAVAVVGTDNAAWPSAGSLAMPRGQGGATPCDRSMPSSVGIGATAMAGASFGTTHITCGGHGDGGSLGSGGDARHNGAVGATVQQGATASCAVAVNVALGPLP